MPEYAFEPGEEKLAAAYEMIQSLQQNVVQLATRSTVDKSVISALVQSHPDHVLLLDVWNAVTAHTLPDIHLRNLAGLQSDAAANEANSRTAFWTGLLQDLAGH